MRFRRNVDIGNMFLVKWLLQGVKVQGLGKDGLVFCEVGVCVCVGVGGCEAEEACWVRCGVCRYSGGAARPPWGEDQPPTRCQCPR